MKLSDDILKELNDYNKRNISKISDIIVHCSDSDIPAHDDIKVIHEWHLKRGFICVGYHFFITKNQQPRIQTGRPIQFYGSHCRGHNKRSIGICLSGKNFFTKQQFINLSQLVVSLDTVLPKTLRVSPHNKFNKSKTCPNFQFTRDVTELFDGVNWQYTGEINDYTCN